MLKIRFAKLAYPLVLAAMLGACGGGGSSAPSGGTPPSAPPDGTDDPVTPNPIVGVSMPSSVSVVTATNASR